jgi:hypothetical protein
MEVEILHPFAIHPQVAINIRVFGESIGRTGVALLDFAQPFLIDFRAQRRQWQRKKAAPHSPPRAPIG